MPEEFIGAARGVRVPEAAKAAEDAKAATVAAPPSRKAPLVLMGSGVLVLIGLAAGAYFILRTPPSPRSTPVPNPQSLIPTPAPRPTSTPPRLAAPTSTPATSTPPAAVITAPKPLLRNALDTDVDGLTDEEERLYGSDPIRPDSDNDGFLDGNEVFNLYSPAAPAPATLQETQLATSYADNLGRYSVLYPTSWEVRTVDVSKGIQQFSSGGEAIQVQVEENQNRDAIAAWYLARSPGVSRSELESFTTKGGYAGLRSPDRQTVYIGFEAYVFVVSYDPGPAPELHFRRTFEMIINSLRGIRAS